MDTATQYFLPGPRQNHAVYSGCPRPNLPDLSQVYPEAHFLVNFRYYQVENQYKPSQAALLKDGRYFRETQLEEVGHWGLPLMGVSCPWSHPVVFPVLAAKRYNTTSFTTLLHLDAQSHLKPKSTGQRDHGLKLLKQ